MIIFRIAIDKIHIDIPRVGCFKEIKDILRLRGKVDFYSLFSINTREYIVITFLTILNMSKNKELKIIQEDNFSPIIVEGLDYE